MAGLTLLDDGQGSGKQKWEKGLTDCSRRVLPRVGGGVVGERRIQPAAPPRKGPVCVRPRGLDHTGKRRQGNLLQSLVLSQGILKSYEKEKGNSSVRASPLPTLYSISQTFAT